MKKVAGPSTNGAASHRAEAAGASPAGISRAFARLRNRLLVNSLRSLIVGSRLRLSMILICSLIFWVGLFGLFYGGFEFLSAYIELTDTILEYLFGVFFLSLLVMLFFSTGIIVHTGLFQSREAAYLLSGPASPDRIFAHKFVEAIAFSSWGFLLLGSPLMVAYGLTAGVSGWFYVIFLAYLLAFVVIPGSLGAVASVLVANFLPRRQKSVLLALSVGSIVAGVVWVARAWKSPAEPFSEDWLDGMLGKLAFSQHSLLPSRWMSAGLVASARGEWSAGLFYLFVLVAHAGLAYLIAAVIARDLYRPGYGRVQGGRSSRRRGMLSRFDAPFHRLFPFIPQPIRILILKDIRTFLRDPAQWSQFLIFFGLLGFYFVNIRKLGYDVQSPYWRNLLSLLNLSVTALILSTFTSRFIFPMLSLEGRNFWVLGLLPLERASILWGKFAFSVGISLVASEGLVILSDLQLRIEPAMVALHMGVVAILCLGLSGISVGLGARMPNLKEDDPSKIAAGFGGTLNLLVSLLFILTIIGSLAIPCHLYFAGREHDGAGAILLSLGQFRLWLGLAIAASVIVGVLGIVVPLRIGINAFRTMEF
jgi:ABC-2 type transport system permease protein